MAAAGNAHVVVFAVRDARRTFEFVRDERGDGGRMRGLTFFSAESAAHSFGHDNDLVDRQSEEVRDHVLHLGRILRR